MNDGSDTFRNFSNKKLDAIDLSIVSENMNELILEWKVDRELFDQNNYSDHFCLILEFDINFFIEKAIDRYTWRFDCNKNHIFRKLVAKYMEKWLYFYIARLYIV